MTTMKINSITNLPWKKLIFSALIAATVAFSPHALRATLPSTTTGSGGNLTVVYPSSTGTVTTGITGSTLTINSSAPITVLNWANFWDGTANGGTSAPGDIINFALPGATASILNNVSAGGAGTTINGSITSNGKVFLLNSAGITIGATGYINTAGFYASTVPENLAYFEANGNLQVFTSTPPAAATTGAITTTAGATIATVGGGGDIRLAGAGVSLGAGSITGNVFVTDVSASAAVTAPNFTVASTSSGGTTVGGNLTITGKGAAVNLGSTSGNVGGNLSVTTGGGTLTLGTITVTGNSAINTTGSTNGNVTGGSLSTAGATIVTGTGSSTNDGTVNLPNVFLGTTGGVPNAISITGGATSLTDSTAAETLTIGNSTISGNLAISAAGSISTQNFGSTATTPAVVTLTTTTSTLALTAGTGGLTGNINFNGAGSENITTLTSSGVAGAAAAITATGNINLNTAGVITIPTLSLTTTSGTIGQTAAAGITSATSVAASAPTITLDSVNNTFPKILLTNGVTNSTVVTNNANLTLATKTATLGNATITNSGGNILLGAANADVLSFGGNLALNLTGAAANDSLNTNAGTVTITGNTTITSSGLGTATGPAGTGNAINLGVGGSLVTQAYNFTGPIVTTVAGTTGGNITIWANSPVVLGATNTGGTIGPSPATLTVTSAATGGVNGITNPTGVVTATGTSTFAAGTKASPSNIQIGTTSANLIPAVVFNTGNNVSLTNGVATTITAGTNPITGLTTLTQSGAGAASAITATAAFNNLSIIDTGASPTGAVAVTIPSGNSTTLTNLAIKGTGTVNVTTTNGAITLGSGIADTTSGLTTLAANGTLANITDTAGSPVSIFGAVTFSSDGPINVSNNTANSIGGVSFAATTGAGTNNNNITYTEGGGVNLQGIAVGAGYTGTIALTSVNSIITNGGTTSNIVTPASAKLTLTATSAAGAVLLNNPTFTADNIASPVSITATTNSAIWDSVPLILSNVTVSTGKLAANTKLAGVGAGAITQAAGTTIWTYDSDTFITAGSTIALTNSGNNFGGITIDTTNAGVTPAGANATIKEFGGNNYVSVNTGTAGKLTGTSEQSIILETGNAGIIAGGQVTLSAPNGGITALATGNNFNAADNAAGSLLILTTTGNATVSEKGGTVTQVTVLGDGTNVGGNLTLTNSSANGTIKDNGITGNITVGGNAAFVVATTGTGLINFTAANNSIPNLQLKAGSGSSVFQSNTNINILPGTLVVGPATISAGGSITMTTPGPVSFANTLGLNAQAGAGNITFTDTSAIFNGKVTAVTAVPTGDVNFSALSLATNFNSIAPSVTTANNATYYQAPAP